MQNPKNAGESPPEKSEPGKVGEYLTRLILANDHAVASIDAILDLDEEADPETRKKLLRRVRSYLAGHTDRPRCFCFGEAAKYNLAGKVPDTPPPISDAPGGTAKGPAKRSPGK